MKRVHESVDYIKHRQSKQLYSLTEELKHVHIKSDSMDAVHTVRVPSYRIVTDDGGAKFTAYLIQVHSGSRRVWEVRRRYNDFKRLHEALEEELGQVPALPPKRLFGAFVPDFLEQRRGELEQYLRTLLSNAAVLKNSEFRSFMWQGHAMLVQGGQGVAGEGAGEGADEGSSSAGSDVDDEGNAMRVSADGMEHLDVLDLGGAGVSDSEDDGDSAVAQVQAQAAAQAASAQAGMRSPAPPRSTGKSSPLTRGTAAQVAAVAAVPGLVSGDDDDDDVGSDGHDHDQGLGHGSVDEDIDDRFRQQDIATPTALAFAKAAAAAPGAAAAGGSTSSPRKGVRREEPSQQQRSPRASPSRPGQQQQQQQDQQQQPPPPQQAAAAARAHDEQQRQLEQQEAQQAGANNSSSINMHANGRTPSTRPPRAPLSAAQQQQQQQQDAAEPAKPRLEDFEMVRVLGKGSFGKVMLCRKRDSGKLYAMKVLKKQHVIKRKQVAHTRTERSVLGQVDHPFVVKLHYAFQTGDKLHFVLDFCSGGELFFHLGRAGRFSEHLGRFYAAEIALALGHLHGKGVVYRDLKPENILLDSDGHIKLADFGLSKEGINESVKGTHSFCGTPEYLAPEVLNRTGHGSAVDWWSLGALLYEMLTGLPPWYSQDRQKMFASIRSSELRFPEYISALARMILGDLLERDVTKRLGSNCDIDEVKAHAFFAPMDWERLYAREVPSPFVPRLNSQTDTGNFDSQFTRLPINSVDAAAHLSVSPTPNHGLLSGSNAEQPLFDGFTYVEQSAMVQQFSGRGSGGAGAGAAPGTRGGPAMQTMQAQLQGNMASTSPTLTSALLYES